MYLILSMSVIILANKVTSGYDSCIVGFDFPSPVSENVLSCALQLLKPGGNLWILEATIDVENENDRLLTKDRLQSKLKLNGFVGVEFKVTAWFLHCSLIILAVDIV